MLEIPNVSIPFNSAPVHSTHPHNVKKLFTLSFQTKFRKIGFVKVTCTCSFFIYLHFFCSQCQPVPGAYLGQNGPRWPTSNTQKMPKNGRVWAKNGKKCTVENCGTIYLDPKSKNNCSLLSRRATGFEIWPFEVEIPVRAIFPLYL